MPVALCSVRHVLAHYRHAHPAHGCGGRRSGCKLLASTHWSGSTLARRRRRYPGECASCGHTDFAPFDMFGHIIGMRIAHTGAVAAIAGESLWEVPIGPARRSRADDAATRMSVRRADTRISHRSTCFGILSACASRTRVRWPPERLQSVGEYPLVLFDTRTPTPHLPGRACVVQTLVFRTVRHNRHAHRAHGCGGRRGSCKLFASTHWSFFTCARRRRVYPGERASCGHSYLAPFDIIGTRIAPTGVVAAVANEDCWRVPIGLARHAHADAASTRASVRRADSRSSHRSN